MSKNLFIAFTALLLAACGGSSDVGPRQLIGPLVDIRLQTGDCTPSDLTEAVTTTYYSATVEGQYLLPDGSRTEWRLVRPDRDNNNSSITVIASGVALDQTMVVENNSTASFAVVATGEGNISITGSVYNESTNAYTTKLLDCSQQLIYSGLDFIKVGEAATDSNGAGTVGEQAATTLVNTPVNFSAAGFARTEDDDSTPTQFPAGCGYTLTVDPNNSNPTPCEVSGSGSNSAVITSNGQPVSLQCSLPGTYPVIVSDIVVDTNVNPDATVETCTPNVAGPNDNIAINQGSLIVTEDDIDVVRGYEPVCTLRVDITDIPREGSVASADDCPTSDRSVAEPPVFLGGEHAFTAIVKKPDSETYYHAARLTEGTGGAERAWDFDLFDGGDETTANNITSTSNCVPFGLAYNEELGAQILTAPSFTNDLTRCQGQFVQAFLVADPALPANGPAEILQPQIDEIQIAIANNDVISGATTDINVSCHFVGGNQFLPCNDLADFVVANWDADDANCSNATFVQAPQGIDASMVVALQDANQAGNCSLTLSVTDNEADDVDAVPLAGLVSNTLNFNLLSAPVVSFKIEPELSCVGRTSVLQSLATGSNVKGQSALTLTDVVREVPNCSGDGCVVDGAELDANDLIWSDATNVQPGYWNGSSCQDSVVDTGALGDLTQALNGFVSGGIDGAECSTANTEAGAGKCYEATSMLRLQTYCVTATVPENLAANQDDTVISGTTIIVLPVADDQLLSHAESICETLDPVLSLDLIGEPGVGPQLLNTLGNVLDPLLATLDTGAGNIDNGLVGTAVETLLFGVEDTFPYGLATITAVLLGDGGEVSPIGLNLIGAVEVLGGCVVSPLLDVIGIPLDFLLGNGFNQDEFAPFDGCEDSAQDFVDSFTGAFQ